MPDGGGCRPVGFDPPPFRPRFPWFGRHLQTIRNTVCRPVTPLPRGNLLTFPMDDGSGDRLLGEIHAPVPRTGCGRPLAVLLHGLTGSQDSYYVRATAGLLLRLGYPVLRLNLRGAGPSAATCSRRYHAGRSQDLRAVLAALPSALTADGVVVVGWSLGGNCVLKFLGEGDFPVPVRAGAAVSAPIDLAASSRLFGARANRLYHNRLLGQMKVDMLSNRARVGDRWADAAQGAVDLWDFDDKVVGPWNGWSGAPEYYAVNSGLGFLPRIAVPTLVVHALDDPWIPPDAYRDFDWTANACLMPAIAEQGGHVGFHGRDGIWSDRCLEGFLATL